jgi:hypothetical protein
MMFPQAAKILAQLTEENRPLLATYDPDRAVVMLDRLPVDRPYNHVPAELAALWNEVARDFSENGFAAFQGIAMLRLIGDFDRRAASVKYSDGIRQRFDYSLNRIVRSIADPTFEKYRKNNDILLKDLGICRQKLIPTGSCVVEETWFHRSLLWRGGLGQAVGVVKALIECGGNGPFYEIHTHLSELEEYDAEGWDRAYVRMGELLDLNPRVKGVWGGSWFYDPEIERVSPRLAYLRQRPQQRGAYVFFSSVDLDGGALSKSQTRREMYEQGKYLPKAYVIVWPRRKVLAWSRQAKLEPAKPRALAAVE